MPDSQSREPGFESHLLINEYLAIDGGGNMNSLRAITAEWLECFPEKLRMNRSARG